ncbi:MAG: DUF3806 domain-containing protein [Gammaproteobacteria bacterium]|nr:DUF3806 domain-containing protein [Gammaproteobacteria bacterium]
MIPNIALGLALICTAAAAQPDPEVQALTQQDHKFMRSQRQRIDDLARSGLGRQLNGSRENDLGILQQLLDKKLVRADKTLELQAMGVVLGDFLAQDPSAKWVTYRDQRGRSRALQIGNSDYFLFPVTMISRRAEVGAEVDVDAIFEKANTLMQPYRQRLPFQ